MVIRVAPNLTAASITSVKPRVSVVVTSPVVTASVSVPAASIEYVELVVGAGLDTTGRFRYVQEIVVMSEFVGLSVSKPAQDEAVIADASSFEFDANTADSVALTDVFFKLLIFTRNFADQVDLSDAQQFQLAKALADAVEAQDASAFALNKPLLDGVGVADHVALQAIKAVLDAIALGDLQVKSVAKALSDPAVVMDAAVLATQRPVTDAALVSDISTVSAAKGLFDQQQINDVTQAAVNKAVADAVLMVESATFAVGKLFSDATLTADQVSLLVNRLVQDGVAMSDSADLEDGITFQAAKSVMNMAFVTDHRQSAFSKPQTDAAAAADAGSLVSQGYCDLTYFAEDYVGEARTF
jgi:hypothetical protein